MIVIESITSNIVKFRITDTLKAGDFSGIAPRIDALIQEKGTILLFLDGTLFKGWDNIVAAQEHFTFVKNHHAKVEKIAVIAGNPWQHWLAAFANLFVHPDIKVFEPKDISAALQWITED